MLNPIMIKQCLFCLFHYFWILQRTSMAISFDISQFYFLLYFIQLRSAADPVFSQIGIDKLLLKLFVCQWSTSPITLHIGTGNFFSYFLVLQNLLASIALNTGFFTFFHTRLNS